jgi:tetratricopeptide (TPR) repeat protein
MSCRLCGAVTRPNGKALLECTGGCNTFYCSKTCHEKDWRLHKLECKVYQSNECRVCQKSGVKGNPLYRSCACRGDKGFGHLHCFVDFAKDRPSLEDTAYEKCPICNECYRKEVRQFLADQKSQEAATGNIREQLEAKNILGLSYLDSGKNQEAYDCFKEISDVLRGLLGEPRFLRGALAATAVMNLATAALCLGRLEEALAWSKRLDQESQNGIVEWAADLEPMVVANLASVYNSLRQLEKALPYAERAVQLQIGIVGDTVTDVLTKQTLASIYSNLGQHDKAIATQKEAYKKAGKVLGSSHPVTKISKESLVNFEAWAKAPPELHARVMTARRRTKAIGTLSGIVNEQGLDGTIVEVLSFCPEKKKYTVRGRGVRDGSTPSEMCVKPVNLILDQGTVVFVHSLQSASQYNGKEGAAISYSNESGRYAVKVDGVENLLAIKPHNILAKHQADFDVVTTRTWALMLSEPPVLMEHTISASSESPWNSPRKNEAIIVHQK